MKHDIRGRSYTEDANYHRSLLVCPVGAAAVELYYSKRSDTELQVVVCVVFVACGHGIFVSQEGSIST